MAIVSGKILDVRATKKSDDPVKNFSVNVNLDDFKAEGDKASVRYTYSINYEPGVASMQVFGQLSLQLPRDKMKECKDRWEKDRTLPVELAEDVITAITYTCTTVGTLLAYAIGVASPISTPRAKLAPGGPAKPAQ